MTLILTYICNDFCTQVSDRLITVGSAPYDEYSNKVILYGGRNALVSIGYTGPAFLEDTPTDEWLAEKVYGRPIPRGPCGTRPVGAANKSHVTPGGLTGVMERIVGGLRRQERSQLGRPQNYPLELAVSGFNLSHSFWHPYFVQIIRPKGESNLVFNTNRHLFLNQCEFEISGSGGWLERHRDLKLGLVKRISTARDLGNGRIEFVEKQLTWAIREFAKREQTIGKNLMSILLVRPQALAKIRYLPELGIGSEYPVGYSPCVIGPQSLSSPAAMLGVWDLHAGGHQVELSGIAGSRFMLSAQRRPLPPS